MAAGDFSATQALALKLAAKNAWADAKVNKDDSFYDPSVEVVNQIAANDTTAFKREITTADNCAGVEIGWMEPNTTVSSSSNYQNHQVIPCDVDGPLAESKIVQYKLERMVKTNFGVKEAMCKNMENFQSIYAYQSLDANRKLIAELGKQLLTKVHGFAGVNKVPSSSVQEYGGANIGTIPAGNTTVTKIPKGNMIWQDFVPYLELVRQENKFRSPYVLDGTLFFKQLILASLETSKEKANAFQLANITADRETFAAAGMLNKMFALDRGAVAMAFKAVNPADPEQTVEDMMRWREPIPGLVLPRIGQVYKDVYMSRKKVAVNGQSGDCELYRYFEFRLVWDAWKNPTFTGDTGTGILEFEVDPTLPTICSPAPYNCPPVPSF